MKILLLIPSLHVEDGGTAKTTPALAAALGRLGWSVDLATTDMRDSGNFVTSQGEWAEQDGYRVRYFARLGRTEFKPSSALFVWLWRHVSDYAAVHINSNFNFPVLVGSLACRLRKIPYLLTPHGMLEPWALGYKAWKKRAYYLGVERPLVLRGAAAIQALNSNEAVNIEALHLGPAIVTLPNGINQQDAQDIAPTDREVFLRQFPVARGKMLLLFMHRIDPKKGLDLLARAFATVHTQFPQTHLVIAGPDSVNFSETVRGFFEQAGCGGSDAVTFTGMLEGTLKRGALAAAAIFVAPSYSEGFSMSVLEAMAARLPCVITTGCNFPEAGQADAARVVPIDADAFSASLLELVGDAALREAVGSRAKELVLRDYTWDSVAARFQAIIVKLLLPLPDL